MLQRVNKKTTRGLILSVAILILIFLPMISASEFDKILEPLQTIYDLMKYSATLISGLIMLFAGISYITSGSDPGKREKSKNMVMYVIIGLMVIWAAPFVVELILGS